MRLFAAILLLGLSITIHSQETCPLPIMVSVDNSAGSLSGSNVRFLESKLAQLVASRGFGSSAEMSHLCLKASVSETGDKQIISGNRPVIAGSLDVYLVLTNLLSGENFGADNIAVRGAGNSEAQRLQSAVARINPSNRELQLFLQNARVKVFDYYRSHIPSILHQAKAYSQRGEYDKALYVLGTVPPCVDGYDDVAAQMLATFAEYLDVDCNRKLNKARALWLAGQDDEAAKAAAAYIAAIDSRSACFPEAMKLLDTIGSRIDENQRRIIAREDEERALQLELIRGKAALDKQKIDNDFLLRQQEIDAIRQLALAYAQSVLPAMANVPASIPDVKADDNSGRRVSININ